MSWYFFSTGHKLSFPGHFLNIKRKLYCLRHLLWRVGGGLSAYLATKMMVADPFFWEKAQKLNQWLFLQVGLSLCDRLTFAILCFGLLQLFSTVLSESEFFLYMNLASVSTGLIFVQLSDSWHWPMLEKFIYTIFMFPKTIKMIDFHFMYCNFTIW